MIIDGDNYTNVARTLLFDRTELICILHPNLYKLHWLDGSRSIVSPNRYEFYFILVFIKVRYCAMSFLCKKETC